MVVRNSTLTDVDTAELVALYDGLSALAGDLNGTLSLGSGGVADVINDIAMALESPVFDGVRRMYEELSVDPNVADVGGLPWNSDARMELDLRGVIGAQDYD